MSERKSWDIQPKRKAAVAPAPAPQPVVAQRKPLPKREKVPQGKEREPLRARRKRARRKMHFLWLILLGLIIIGFFVVLWIPTFRIQRVEATGPDAEAVQTISMHTLQGAYYFVFPRSSLFFFPQKEIRAAVLNQYPDIAAISISRTSLQSISVQSIPRESAIIWCGEEYQTMPQITASSTEAISASCYHADAQGVVFAEITDALEPGSIRLYGALSASSTSPIGGHIANASTIPNALQFVKAMKELNVPITALVIRGDEADLYAASGTRITYVLGREQKAARLAESTFPSLNLNNGSLEYVDLRFDGKVYFKQRGGAESTSGQ